MRHTSGGDQGRTSLLSGERVAKNHPRMEACGDVDELNCVLGALVAALPQGENELQAELLAVQSSLFQVGAVLATTRGSPAAGLLHPFAPEETDRLESAIDRLERVLPALQSFVLPGGHPVAAWAHVARAVCRRAERSVVSLAAFPDKAGKAEDVDAIVPFLNRLSNYLFAVARYCNHRLGVAERAWRA